MSSKIESTIAARVDSLLVLFTLLTCLDALDTNTSMNVAFELQS